MLNCEILKNLSIASLRPFFFHEKNKEERRGKSYEIVSDLFQMDAVKAPSHTATNPSEYLGRMTYSS